MSNQNDSLEQFMGAIGLDIKAVLAKASGFTEAVVAKMQETVKTLGDQLADSITNGERIEPSLFALVVRDHEEDLTKVFEPYHVGERVHCIAFPPCCPTHFVQNCETLPDIASAVEPCPLVGYIIISRSLQINPKAVDPNFSEKSPAEKDSVWKSMFKAMRGKAAKEKPDAPGFRDCYVVMGFLNVRGRRIQITHVVEGAGAQQQRVDKVLDGTKSGVGTGAVGSDGWNLHKVPLKMLP